MLHSHGFVKLVYSDNVQLVVAVRDLNEILEGCMHAKGPLLFYSHLPIPRFPKTPVRRNLEYAVGADSDSMGKNWYETGFIAALHKICILGISS